MISTTIHGPALATVVQELRREGARLRQEEEVSSDEFLPAPDSLQQWPHVSKSAPDFPSPALGFVRVMSRSSDFERKVLDGDFELASDGTRTLVSTLVIKPCAPLECVTMWICMHTARGFLERASSWRRCY